MVFAASAKPLVGMPLDRVAAMILVAWIGDADSRNLTGRQDIARRNAGQPAGPTVMCETNGGGCATGLCHKSGVNHATRGA